MDSLIKMLGGALTPQIMSSLAGLTGESQTGTKSLTDSVISSLVGALADKGKTESGAQGVLDMLNTSHKGVNLDDVAGDFAGILGDSGRRDSVLGAGDGILSALMPGNKMNGALDLITGAAGVKRGSSSMMMRLLAPLAMGLLRTYVTKKGLGALGLSQFLGGQKEFIQQASTGSNDRTTNRVETNRGTAITPKKSGGLPGWLLPLVGLVLLVLLGWWLFNNVINKGDDNESETSTKEALCTGLTELSDGVNKLPLADDSGFVDALGDLDGTFDTVISAGEGLGIPTSLLNSAWNTLSEAAGSGDVGSIENGIEGILGATDSLMTGQSCPVPTE